MQMQTFCGTDWIKNEQIGGTKDIRGGIVKTWVEGWNKEEDAKDSKTKTGDSLEATPFLQIYFIYIKKKITQTLINSLASHLL